MAFGLVLRKFGPPIMYLTLGFVLVGHSLFCLGIFTSSFPLMVIGRIVNGAGSEPSICVLFYLTKVFIDEENLLIINSGILVASRLIAMSSFYFNPQMYIEYKSFNLLIFVSILVLVIAIVSFAVFYNMAKRKTITKDDSSNEDNSNGFQLSE